MIVVIFRKLLVFEFQVGISESFFPPHFNISFYSKIFPSARCASVVMVFVVTLTYVEPIAFLVIVFYGDTFYIDKVLIVFS
jgi:hypothetical protein